MKMKKWVELQTSYPTYWKMKEKQKMIMDWAKEHAILEIHIQELITLSLDKHSKFNQLIQVNLR